VVPLAVHRMPMRRPARVAALWHDMVSPARGSERDVPVPRREIRPAEGAGRISELLRGG
jgi:hypothetical protein